MFFSLVKNTLDAFHSVAASSTYQMESEMEYNPFDDGWAMLWVDFIYKHYDGVKLLICCSKGSAYENFEEELIRKETEANKAYADILRASGKMKKEISDMQWHILATAYIHLIFEVVRHDQGRSHRTYAVCERSVISRMEADLRIVKQDSLIRKHERDPA